MNLLDNMWKYEMDSASIVEDTERTRFSQQTDRRTGEQTDKVKPFNFVVVVVVVVVVVCVCVCGGGGDIVDQAGHNCAIFDSIWYLLHIPYHTWSI